MKALGGIIPIVVTTFSEDGTLDLESQRRLIRHLLDQGVHGLALFGNASEGYALTDSEREKILALTISEVDGSVPVIVSSGHNGTHGAIELSCAAEKAGSDALMILPPSISNLTRRRFINTSRPSQERCIFQSSYRTRRL